MTTLPVGPERDRAVAELLGCTTWDSADIGCTCNPDCPHDVAIGCSEHPAAAFEALEMWRGQKPGRFYEVASPVEGAGNSKPRVDQWDVTLYHYVENVANEPAYAEAPTFPDAATLALLATQENSNA